MNKELMQKFSLGEQLCFDEISPGFPVIKVNNHYATATISLYGGQLLEYKPHDQSEPVIWLSRKAVFMQNKAIRGGIPLCWPWFGDYNSQSVDATLPAHGFARIVYWDIKSTQTLKEGGTEVILKMPCDDVCLQYKKVMNHFNCQLLLKITITDVLKLELISINHSQQEVPISNALHSYFNISNIRNVNIQGLEKTTFHDKLNGEKSSFDEAVLKFDRETDRVFVDTHSDIVLTDPDFGRKIIISKENSSSTVIWNPWQEKSTSMSDMSNDAWLQMVCIEPANVSKNQLLLAPGEMHSISLTITVNQIL